MAILVGTKLSRRYVAASSGRTCVMIKEYVKQCDKCQRMTKLQESPPSPCSPCSLEPSNTMCRLFFIKGIHTIIFQVGVDLIEPLPATKRGNK